MSEQKSMLDQLGISPPIARKSDPETSHKAAKNVKHGSRRHKILLDLKDRASGLATFEIAEHLGVDRDSISPHMKPLERLGFIKRTGGSVLNPKTNQKCELWALSDTILIDKFREISISIPFRNTNTNLSTAGMKYTILDPKPVALVNSVGKGLMGFIPVFETYDGAIEYNGNSLENICPIRLK